MALLRTWPGLLSVSIAVTIVGAWLPWSYDGPVRLGGLEGSHDGWLAVLAACAAIATVRGVRRGAWPQLLIAFVCSGSALYFVLRDGPPPDSSLGWGWFVALIGALGMFVAAIGAIVARLRESESRWVRQPFSWRRAVGGGVLVALALLVALIFWQVLFITEHDSWPPSADAITADGAQAAAEAFTSGSPRPRDLDLDYAWSTSAIIEPFAEGAEFYPRIVDDIENAEHSVHILMFGWDSNEIGTELADVLKQKLADGVEVRIAVDDQGSNPSRLRDVPRRLAIGVHRRDDRATHVEVHQSVLAAGSFGDRPHRRHAVGVDLGVGHALGFGAGQVQALADVANGA